MKNIIILILALTTVFAGTGCKKEENRQEEDQLAVDNKLIIGEWRHQSTKLNVYDAITGAAKNIQDYDVPVLNTLTFTADGKFSTNLGEGGSYVIDSAGTQLMLKDFSGKKSKAEISTLSKSTLIITLAEVSEGTRLVMVQSFSK